MSCSAAAGSVLRGSASAAVAAFRRSRSWMPFSSAIASSTMSRPSSERPMVNRRTRGEDGRERAAVGVGGGGVHQFARRAGDAVQEGARGDHGRRGGQIGDPGREEARLGGGACDLLDRARFGGVRGNRLRGAELRGEGEQSQQEERLYRHEPFFAGGSGTCAQHSGSQSRVYLLNIRSTTGRLILWGSAALLRSPCIHWTVMPRNPRYDVLFEPVKIGPVTARNRFYAVPHAAA